MIQQYENSHFKSLRVKALNYCRLKPTRPNGLAGREGVSYISFSRGLKSRQSRIL